MIGYAPVGLAEVAVVVKVGSVASLPDVSPLTNPVYFTVRVGTAVPWRIAKSSGLIINGAARTLNVPLTKLIT